MLIRNIFSGLMALTMTACTQVGTQIANLPAKFSDMTVHKDIAYGDHPVQKLDIYVPKDADQPQSSYPVLIFFHGGSWKDGSKDMYAFVGKTYTEQGYVVVIPDYQKYPNVKFPTFVEDGAKATAWVHDNIGTYQGDTQNLFLKGHSSGAHIAALVLADQNYLKQHGKTPQIINAFSGVAGPYDFIPQAEDYKDMFGPPSNYPNMQVPTFINGDEPPMLLIWGNQDEIVIRRNLDRLETKIKEKDGIVDIQIYEGVGHVGTISSLVWFLPRKANTVSDTLNFFKQYKN